MPDKNQTAKPGNLVSFPASALRAMPHQCHLLQMLVYVAPMLSRVANALLIEASSVVVRDAAGDVTAAGVPAFPEPIWME